MIAAPFVVWVCVSVCVCFSVSLYVCVCCGLASCTQRVLCGEREKQKTGESAPLCCAQFVWLLSCLPVNVSPPSPAPTHALFGRLLPRPSYTFCNAFLLLLQILQANRQKQTTSMLRNLKLHSAALVAVAVVAARVVAVVALVVAVRIAFCINCQRKSACHSTGFPFPVASAPFLVSLSISHSLSLVLSLSWFRCLLLG